MEQRIPLRTGPWEEHTSFPKHTEKASPLDLVEPLLSSGQWFWVTVLDKKYFKK